MLGLARLYPLVTLSLVLVACSDDGLGIPADTNPGGTTVASDDGGSSDPSHGDASGGGASTGPTGPLDGTTSGGPSDTDGSDTMNTGEPPPVSCDAPDQCVVVNDCCRCEVFHVDDPIPECPKECLQPTCDALGVPADLGTACDDGQCGWEHRNCSPTFITCDSLTPECPEGLAPEVTPEGDCWTGACIPIEACDGLPSCDLCTEDEVCVTFETMIGPVFDCAAIPEACMGVPACDCIPDACTGGFNVCMDAPDGLHCSCPAC